MIYSGSATYKMTFADIQKECVQLPLWMRYNYVAEKVCKNFRFRNWSSTVVIGMVLMLWGVALYFYEIFAILQYLEWFFVGKYNFRCHNMYLVQRDTLNKSLFIEVN